MQNIKWTLQSVNAAGVWDYALTMLHPEKVSDAVQNVVSKCVEFKEGISLSIKRAIDEEIRGGHQ